MDCLTSIFSVEVKKRQLSTLFSQVSDQKTETIGEAVLGGLGFWDQMDSLNPNSGTCLYGGPRKAP